MLDENSAIEKAKNGDGESFGKLYDRYLSQIYRFIFLKVGNQADAEDLTHQAFMKAWQGLKSYNSQGFPFSSWLYKIAANTVIDFYRVERRHLNIDDIGEDTVAVPESSTKETEINISMDAVKIALTKLEPDQQNVIIMKFVNGLTTKEVAESINKTEGAVRVIQHRALKNLKKLLGSSNKTFFS